MSSYGRCWRCAERDAVGYGVELPGDEGPLCERCRQEREDIAAIRAAASVPTRRTNRRAIKIRHYIDRGAA